MDILYVEDDPGIGSLLSKYLRAEKHEVTVVGTVSSAHQQIVKKPPEVVLCDHDLPDGTGLELIQSLLADHPGLPCIMLTGMGCETLAVSAMKAGAHDYIVKDIENNFLSLVPVVINRIGKQQRLQQELQVAERERTRLEAHNRYLATTLKKRNPTTIPIGQHPEFKRVLNLIEQVGPTDVTVLISGETGTGKEMAAQLIHDVSDRADQPFVTLNCAALPPQLVESELFGHEKGAFTGAIKSHIGRFEAADNGTLFLDEVGELPLELQPKLLRALQESRFERVGSTESRSVDIRIIAATNQNVPEMVANKQFRADLYYRLNVIPVQIPALRSRPSDIEPLFMHFVRMLSARHQLQAPDIPDDLTKKLRDHNWPGNVRELSNYVERCIITQKWDSLPITGQHAIRRTDGEGAGQHLTLDEVEKQHILRVLQQTNGVIAGRHGAAQILGLNANTLRSRMKKLGIEKPRFTS